eukprot:6936146-Alexandrium_andersonii.AAC.1
MVGLESCQGITPETNHRVPPPGGNQGEVQLGEVKGRPGTSLGGLGSPRASECDFMGARPFEKTVGD